MKILVIEVEEMDDSLAGTTKVRVPVPDHWADWKVEIKHLGYEVWLHDPDKEIGVAETAPTALEAALIIQKRMEEFIAMFGVEK